MAWLLIFCEFFYLLSKVWNSTKESSKPNKRHNSSGESTLILRKEEKSIRLKKNSTGGRKVFRHKHKLSYGKLSAKVTFLCFTTIFLLIPPSTTQKTTTHQPWKMMKFR